MLNHFPTSGRQGCAVVRDNDDTSHHDGCGSHRWRKVSRDQDPGGGTDEVSRGILTRLTSGKKPQHAFHHLCVLSTLHSQTRHRHKAVHHQSQGQECHWTVRCSGSQHKRLDWRASVQHLQVEMDDSCEFSSLICAKSPAKHSDCCVSITGRSTNRLTRTREDTLSLMAMLMRCGWKTWTLWWMTTVYWRWRMVNVFVCRNTVPCSSR